MKPIGNESLHANSNYNGAGVVNFLTSKHLSRAQCSQHKNTHKYTCMSPNGKTHNQTSHITTMSDLSQDLTMTLLSIWRLQMFRREWP